MIYKHEICCQEAEHNVFKKCLAISQFQGIAETPAIADRVCYIYIDSQCSHYRHKGREQPDCDTPETTEQNHRTERKFKNR